MSADFDEPQGVKHMQGKIIFRQLFEPQTSTYTYLVADPNTREAVLIDPVLETVDRDEAILNELGLKLKYVLDTHVHADHITAAGELRKRTGALTGVGVASQVECADMLLKNNDSLKIGAIELKVFETPGHTDACLSFVTEGMAFTGDALLIRGTGRTDFQQGSSDKLYRSIVEKLFTLSDETMVYPGHDYRGFTASSIGEEKKFNPRVGGGKTLEDFKRIMNDLKLAHPKKINESVPANLHCGQMADGKIFRPQVVDGVPEISCQDLNGNIGRVLMVDVRTPEEFVGELGHVDGAKLVTLGADLTAFLKSLNKEKEVVFLCRSGGRSGQATIEAQSLGIKHPMNLRGGMIRWNELGYKAVKTNV